jgi:hypothetical protein
MLTSVERYTAARIMQTLYITWSDFISGWALVWVAGLPNGG